MSSSSGCLPDFGPRATGGRRPGGGRYVGRVSDSATSGTVTDSASVTDRVFVESAAEDTLRAAERLSDEAWARLKVHPEKFRVLTGDRPTGPLHLGHYF